jgi:tRNA dimethylallyltransferase
MKNTCIVIVGPTAVGKTALAIKLASHFSTEIISCDSRQCFTELNIGVAKPSNEELASVPHYFINSHSIHDSVNAAVFEQYALEKIQHIFSKKNIAVMVGGTGLYIKAFCDGIDEVPAVDAAVRSLIIENYHANGIEWLQQEIAKNDKVFFKRGEMKNPQRMMRALEIILSTGKSILEFHAAQKKQRDFTIIKIGLQMEREILIERINKRVDIMIQDGLEKEARLLYRHKHLNALQTVGYRELFSHFENETSLQNAIELIKINTRQYAKRQMTWFKKDASIQWSNADYKSVLTIASQKV